MKKILELRILPEIFSDPEMFQKVVKSELDPNFGKDLHIRILKKSIDARQKKIYFNCKLEVSSSPFEVETKITLPSFPDVKNQEEVLIIGFGPCGIFAALECILNGFKPIVLERGKDVLERIQDIKAINVKNQVNPDSNYCFGEGGAGTYSDGKLYTRSDKRGDVKRILELLVGFGANPNILVEAHPHIGTNRLPPIIKKMRECILNSGGEIHFKTRVIDFGWKDQRIDFVKTNSGETFRANQIILATGHSARDIFELLQAHKVLLEPKPIAIGVRIEHPQALIDSIRYHCDARPSYLPAAEYSISKQIQGRGVYSFCMCPGGVIAPCATAEDEIVTNGWSSAERARSTANSGIVVEIRLSDIPNDSLKNPLSVMEYQKSIEHKAWIASGKTQKAPAQRLMDFLSGNVSSDLPKTSYPPGIVSQELSIILPRLITEHLKLAFLEFGNSMKGYLTNEAILHAPETRTSSPVRIPRNPETLEHVNVPGFYPAGEGAGYAGGIVSAAIDGIKVAQKIAEKRRKFSPSKI